MKTIARVLLIAAALVTSCKKDNDNPRSHSESIKNTTWTGEMKYVSKSYAEPFSVVFKDDGTFRWHDFSGDHTGAYTIDNGKGKISATFSNGRIFSALITADKKFNSFEYGQIDWELRNVELNPAVDQVLDNTQWNGNYNDGKSIYITFKPNSNVTAPSPYLEPVDKIYSRTNGAIRYVGSDGIYSFKFFCVLQNNGTIKGVRETYFSALNKYTYHTFAVTKQ